MKLIVACDPNGGIGYQNRLPWTKIQGDLLRFKQLTNRSTIVMGRNTWDSLPLKPLPNRYHYVVSSQQLDMPSDAQCITWQEFTSPECTVKNSSTWLIGGAQLIESCWEWISEIHLTKTFTQYDCDTFINLIELESKYRCASVESYSDHDYQVWKRI